MTRVWLVCMVCLGGCYAELGLGYAGSSYATAHGSVGLIAHFGEAVSMRAGAAGAIGGYRQEGQSDASAYAGHVALGGHVRLLGDRDQLVANAEVYLPWGGAIYRKKEPKLDEGAEVLRGFVGVGYRHSWRNQDSPAEEDGAFVATIGPEMFRTHPTNSALPDDTRIGGAVSVTFVLRGGALWRFIDCLDAKKDRCNGE